MVEPAQSDVGTYTFIRKAVNWENPVTFSICEVVEASNSPALGLLIGQDNQIDMNYATLSGGAACPSVISSISTRLVGTSLESEIEWRENVPSTVTSSGTVTFNIPSHFPPGHVYIRQAITIDSYSESFTW